METTAQKEAEKWLSAAQFAECQKQFPNDEVTQIRLGQHLFVVRTPDGVTWHQAKVLSNDEDRARQIEADAFIVQSCVIHPPLTERNALLNRKPGLVQLLAKQLSALAGANEAVEVKK